MPYGSQFGGMGINSLWQGANLRQQGWNHGMDALNQAIQYYSQLTHDSNEQEKNRVAAKKQQKRAQKQENKMFGKKLGTSLALGVGGGLVGGAALGALGGGLAGGTSAATSGAATLGAASDVAGALGGVGSGIVGGAAPVVSGGALLGPVSAFGAGGALAGTAGAVPAGVLGSTQLMTAPLAAAGGGIGGGALGGGAIGGGLGGLAGASTGMGGGAQPQKFAFGNSLGQSMGRGALLGVGNALAPGIADNVMNAPYRNAQLGMQAAGLGLGYARLGQDAAEMGVRERHYNAMDAAARQKAEFESQPVGKYFGQLKPGISKDLPMGAFSPSMIPGEGEGGGDSMPAGTALSVLRPPSGAPELPYDPNIYNQAATRLGGTTPVAGFPAFTERAGNYMTEGKGPGDIMGIADYMKEQGRLSPDEYAKAQEYVKRLRQQNGFGLGGQVSRPAFGY